MKRNNTIINKKMEIHKNVQKNGGCQKIPYQKYLTKFRK